MFVENCIRVWKGYVGGVLVVLPERVGLVGCWGMGLVACSLGALGCLLACLEKVTQTDALE
jgi:hypothetical protein